MLQALGREAWYQGPRLNILAIFSKPLYSRPEPAEILNLINSYNGNFSLENGIISRTSLHS